MARSGAELSGRNPTASNNAGIVVVVIDVVVTDDTTSAAAATTDTHDAAAVVVLRVEQVLVGRRFHCRQWDGNRMGWRPLLVDGVLGHGSQRDGLYDRT